MTLPRTELGSFGINTEGASASRAHDAWNEISTDEFIDGAGGLLDEDKLTGLVMEKIVPILPDLEGRWHPSGFMVYPLGMHDTYGSLRLHVWPQGLRQIKERGHGLMFSEKLGLVYDADIHNHAWNIVSHVYAGYTDRIFRLTPMSNGTIEYLDEEDRYMASDIYRVNRVAYDSNGRVTLRPHQLDRFNHKVDYNDGRRWHTKFSDQQQPGGGWVNISVYEDRSDIGAGDLHFIDHGEFHAPTIPYGTFAATLAFNSHRISEGPDVLIRGPLSKASYDRQAVTPAEAELARDQLLSLPSDRKELISPHIAAGSIALRHVIEGSARLSGWY